MRRSRAVTRRVVCCVATLALVSLSTHAEGVPKSWPKFQWGLGAELPVISLTGGAAAGLGVPTVSARFRFFERGFAGVDFGYEVTKVEDADAGHHFGIAFKGGYNIIGTPSTHLGVGGGLGIHAFSFPGADVGMAFNIMAGLYPEAFITEGFAFTSFIGFALAIYSDDATAVEFNNVSRSMVRFRLGSAGPLLGLGFMYYF